MSRKKRQLNTRVQRPVYIIMCEGMTEEQYIEFIRASLPEERISILTERPGSNQKTLFEEAKRRVKQCTRYEHRDKFASMAKKEGLLAGRHAKELVSTALHSKSGDAKTAAVRLRRAHHAASCIFPDDNPSSTVDLLLEAIVKDYNAHPIGKPDPNTDLTVESLY